MQTTQERPVMTDGSQLEALVVRVQRGAQAVLHFAERTMSIMPMEAPECMSDHFKGKGMPSAYGPVPDVYTTQYDQPTAPSTPAEAQG